MQVPTSDLCLDPVGDDDVIVIDASLAEEEEESLFACMPAGSDDEYFRLLKMKEKYGMVLNTVPLTSCDC